VEIYGEIVSAMIDAERNEDDGARRARVQVMNGRIKEAREGIVRALCADPLAGTVRTSEEVERINGLPLLELLLALNEAGYIVVPKFMLDRHVG